MRASWLPLLAIPLGLLAFCLGCGALVSIYRARPALRGRGLAVLGLGLGAVTTVSSVLFIAGLLFQQFSPGQGNRQGWNRNGPGPEGHVPNRMPDQAAASFSSNLAIAVLDTDGQSVSKEPPTLVRARFYDPGNGRASLADKPVYDGLATIELRGYSTLQLPKQSYTLHTMESETNQLKVPLLGLPKEADWVLYRPTRTKRSCAMSWLTNWRSHGSLRTTDPLRRVVRSKIRPCHVHA